MERLAPKNYQEIKDQLGSHSIKDLALSLEIPYNTMAQYLNGFCGMPEVVYNKINNQLEKWEAGD